MKLFKRFKPKVSESDLDKVGKTINEIKECLYCTYQKQLIKECMEKHNVKNNLKSVLKHNIKCKDCRTRMSLIAEHKKKGHK